MPNAVFRSQMHLRVAMLKTGHWGLGEQPVKAKNEGKFQVVSFMPESYRPLFPYNAPYFSGLQSRS